MCAQRLICVWNRRSKESPLDAWNILRPPPHPLCTCAFLSHPCPTDLSGSRAACRECSRHCPSALRLHRIVSLDLSTLGSVKSLSVPWVSLPVALNVPCVPQS